jgi:hypothetical protein
MKREELMAAQKMNKLHKHTEGKMSRDDIIKAVRAACDQDKVDAWHDGFWVLTQEELERFVSTILVASK